MYCLLFSFNTFLKKKMTTYKKGMHVQNDYSNKYEGFEYFPLSSVFYLLKKKSLIITDAVIDGS